MRYVLTLFVAITLMTWNAVAAEFAPKPSMAEIPVTQNLKTQMEELHIIFGVNFIYDSSMKLEIPYTGILMSELSRKESLEKCLETLFSGTGISYEIMKKYIVITYTDSPDKPKDYTILIEEQIDTLSASYITAMMDVPINTTQTGLQRIDGSKLNRGFAFLSSTDVIKTLQTLPGVSGGHELSSGLYVHGGTGSDNLYLMDGVPIYSVGHMLGLFSAFNSDVVNNVDFYKSGFPARYGGRMSSVVDVTTRDGDFNHIKGSFSLGLIDGRFQLEGPIVKGKTSFNVAIRRTWLDVLTVPAFGLYNAFRDKETDGSFNMRYAMTDLNAKFTHRFSDCNALSLSLFASQDNFISKSGSGKDDWEKKGEEDIMESDLRWGNLMANLSWKCSCSDQFKSTVSLYHTQSRSLSTLINSYRYRLSEAAIEYLYECNNNISRIYDSGLKADFSWHPSYYHHLRFGAELVWHVYSPTRIMERNRAVPGTEPVFIKKSDNFYYQGLESSAYLEDEMIFADWLSANIGLRYVMFETDSKLYHRFEPRAALKFTFGSLASLKISYSDMNQFNYRLNSSMPLDLPTSIWMPVTSNIEPMNSRQCAAGVYFNLPHNIKFNIEGYYKTMDNLREYRGVSTLYPPINNWENDYAIGRGKSYGMEMQMEWSDEKTWICANYTLSWSQRLFPELNNEWFFDMFDNRHKFNVSATRKLGQKIELYAGWTFRSGNRITLPSQILPVPEELPNGEIKYNYIPIYTSPNNAILPSYHRLDLGLNIHRTTKRGNESIWNVSVYNAYCYMNALNGIVSPVYDSQSSNVNDYVTTMIGWVPIVPTFSYTLKF